MKMSASEGVLSPKYKIEILIDNLGKFHKNRCMFTIFKKLMTFFLGQPKYEPRIFL